VKLGSLFTGYGGLDMAAEAVFDAETIWVSDIDPGACKIIAHHWPDLPNLGDITDIDWATVEPVDILTGGWPCQPFSLAGKRKGAADERALWPFVAGAVRALRPRHVVLENVAAIATAGELARACADLAALGYVGSWRCLRASDVGAPHGRARIFIAAADTECGRRNGRTGELRSGRWAEPADGGDTPADASRQVLEVTDRLASGLRTPQPAANGVLTADPSSNGRNQRRPEPTRLLRGPDAAQRSDAPTDTAEQRCRAARRNDRLRTAGLVEGHIAWGDYEPAIRRWERVLGRPAPPPTEPSPRGTQRLSPRFVEWMMGLPEGWVTDTPGLTRNQQLKALGNGVVPQQAAAAIQQMQATA
jgi:DNA (cytosine-5)-methyltransferase 1